VPHRTSHAGQVGETDRQTIFGLNGPVSSLEETVTPAPSLARFPVVQCITNFKPDGNRTDHTCRDKSGRFLSRYEFTYDEQGRRKGPLFYKGAHNRLDHCLRFTYGADGRRRAFQEQFAADGTLMFTLHFVYDAEGQRIQQRWLARDGSVLRTYYIGYDAQGNRTNQSSVDAGGRTEWRGRSWFDDRGRMRLHYRRDGIAGVSAHVSYYDGEDQAGNWTRAIRWRSWLARGVVPIVVRERIDRRLTYFCDADSP
jgi:hypothetical protein